MSEGGQFPWKRQVIDQHRGPVGRYDTMSFRNPLPPPPDGQVWQQNPETREWSLVVKDRSSKDVVESKEDVSSSGSFQEHILVPSDTFAGICLRYQITPTELRRANGLLLSTTTTAMSNNILGSTTRTSLWIPLTNRMTQQQRDTLLVSKLQRQCPFLSRQEALYYLTSCDNHLHQAYQQAKEDYEWELKQEQQYKKDSSVQLRQQETTSAALTDDDENQTVALEDDEEESL